MLRVARRRLANEKRQAVPKKPKPPDAWTHNVVYSLDFFWAWERAEYDPRFTPDGKPWDEQDQAFWVQVYYFQELWTWAYHRAKHPVLNIRPTDLTMDKL